MIDNKQVLMSTSSSSDSVDHSQSRPSPKPPFSPHSPLFDQFAIEDVTDMRFAPWSHQLSLSTPTAPSYSSFAPAAAAELLDGIVNGVSIDYDGDRTLSRKCKNHPIDEDSTPGATAQITEIIQKDVLAKKKAGPFDQPPFIPFSCSPIGAVPKHTEPNEPKKIRVIHDLSHPKGTSVNDSIKDIYCPMGSFDQAMEAVVQQGRGCYLIKLDVEAAYKQVPVRKQDWHLIGFTWLDKYYFELALPFGLRSSCRLWELYATALHYFFQHHLGIECVVHYVDDFLFVIKELGTAGAQLQRALELAKTLGIPMAPKKIEGPTHRLIFLGLELDTIAMTARVPHVRLEAMKELLQNWQLKQHSNVKDLESLLGLLQFVTKVIRPGRAYQRRLIDHLTSIKALNTSAKYPAKFEHAIPFAARQDIKWWNQFIVKYNGISLLYEADWTAADKLQIYTDACRTGWGARYENHWIRAQWSGPQLKDAKRATIVSMPWMELFAVVSAAAAWGHLWHRKRIIFNCDAGAVVSALFKHKSKATSSMTLIRHLDFLAATHHFDYKCIHIRGEDNVIADPLSRNLMDLFSQALPTADTDMFPFTQLPPLKDMK